MRTVLNKSNAVWRVIAPVRKRSVKEESVREIVEKSITSGSTVPEVWIMFGLLLSVVTQIAYDNRNDHNE